MSKKFIDGLKRAFRCKVEEVGSLVVKDVNLFGDEEEHTMFFFFFDGFAYCPNYNGKSYIIKNLPRKQYFIEHKKEAETILKELDLKESKELSPFDIAIYYGNITEFGEAVEEDLTLDFNKIVEDFENKVGEFYEEKKNKLLTLFK